MGDEHTFPEPFGYCLALIAPGNLRVGGVSSETATLIGFMGNFGLYSAVVGFAVILLMPEQSGHRFGGAIAILGGMGIGCELVLAHTL